MGPSKLVLGGPSPTAHSPMAELHPAIIMAIYTINKYDCNVPNKIKFEGGHEVTRKHVSDIHITLSTNYVVQKQEVTILVNYVDSTADWRSQRYNAAKYAKSKVLIQRDLEAF